MPGHRGFKCPETGQRHLAPATSAVAIAAAAAAAATKVPAVCSMADVPEAMHVARTRFRKKIALS